VGCQNYDDQFDQLENQITALSQTVAGLSQVQSDLSSLAGTVSSLASTVNGLGDTIDTAVADGLTDIQADIDAIEAAVADVASSEEVSNLSDAVAASQEDLDQLLANGSIYQGAVTINSVATLDVYHKMGSGINIVNGAVSITVNSEMDIVKVQEVVDNILTNVGDYTYTSASSDIAAVTFTKLTGTQSLTVTQAGSYDFRNLTSATNVVLGDSFKSTIGIVHFGALTSVNSFKTGSATNSIVFSKATELHLTSLGRYATTSSNVFTLEVDEGGVIDITALDDVDADGDQADIYLSITGPASFTTSKFEDGALTFEDVETVEVNGFNGTITTNDGVESFTADSLVNDYVVGSDIETLNVTGKVDPDSTTDQSGPDISTSSDNLISATVAGNVGLVSFTSAGNLETVTVSADVAGAITITGNGDLTSVTLTDSKATGVTVSGNNELTSLTIDTTIQAGRGATAAATALLKKDGSIVVTNNTDLTSLTITSKDAKTLTITGNAELATISASGLATIGATTTTGPTVNIYGNNFTATKSEDKENTATTLTSTGGANDLGSFTTTSGMETLKTYLTAVAANAKAAAQVYFDTVESYVGEDGDEDGTDATYSSTTTRDNTTANAEQKILVLVANTADPAVAATKHKRAWVLGDVSSWTADKELQVTVSGLDIFQGDADLTYSSSDNLDLQLSGNPTIDIARIKSAAHVSNATAAEVTIDAKRGANATLTVSLIFHPANDDLSATATSTVLGERYTTGAAMNAAVTTTNHGIGTDEVFTFTVGTNSVTAVLSAVATGSNTTPNTTAIGLVADAIVAAWGNKYGSGGTASATTVATLASTTSGQIVVTGADIGSRGFGLAVSMSVTASGTTATNGSALDWKIGDTRASSDNSTTSDELILLVESNNAGTILDTVTGTKVTVTTANAASTFSELAAATYTADPDDDTGLNTYTAQTEARADVRLPDDGEAAATSNAVSFSRVHWLG